MEKGRWTPLLGGELTDDNLEAAAIDQLEHHSTVCVILKSACQWIQGDVVRCLLTRKTNGE